MTQTSQKRVIALGFFDGVHIGHQELLKKTRAAAECVGAVPAVITFDTYPGRVISGKKAELITSPRDRADIIRRICGIDEVIFLHFDDELMHMSWQEFVEQLVHSFDAVHVVAGYDFHFGYRGEGNAEKLCEKCAQMGIGCDIIPCVEMEGGAVSSTAIRRMISCGDMARAAEFLGHPYTLTDEVRHGYRLGHEIGTPTINMRLGEDVLPPRFGVYASKVWIEDDEYIGVTNIGVRPTVAESDEVSVETHIIGFDGDLYGRDVRVELHTFLRPEMKFENAEKLAEQIRRDALQTKAFFEA